jgi:hypothetical protein
MAAGLERLIPDGNIVAMSVNGSPAMRPVPSAASRVDLAIEWDGDAADQLDLSALQPGDRVEAQLTDPASGAGTTVQIDVHPGGVKQIRFSRQDSPRGEPDFGVRYTSAGKITDIRELQNRQLTVATYRPASGTENGRILRQQAQLDLPEIPPQTATTAIRTYQRNVISAQRLTKPPSFPAELDDVAGRLLQELGGKNTGALPHGLALDDLIRNSGVALTARLRTADRTKTEPLLHELIAATEGVSGAETIHRSSTAAVDRLGWAPAIAPSVAPPEVVQAAGLESPFGPSAAKPVAVPPAISVPTWVSSTPVPVPVLPPVPTAEAEPRATDDAEANIVTGSRARSGEKATIDGDDAWPPAPVVGPAKPQQLSPFTLPAKSAADESWPRPPSDDGSWPKQSAHEADWPQPPAASAPHQEPANEQWPPPLSAGPNEEAPAAVWTTADLAELESMLSGAAPAEISDPTGAGVWNEMYKYMGNEAPPVTTPSPRPSTLDVSAPGLIGEPWQEPGKSEHNAVVGYRLTSGTVTQESFDDPALAAVIVKIKAPDGEYVNIAVRQVATGQHHMYAATDEGVTVASRTPFTTAFPDGIETGGQSRLGEVQDVILLSHESLLEFTAPDMAPQPLASTIDIQPGLRMAACRGLESPGHEVGM